MKRLLIAGFAFLLVNQPNSGVLITHRVTIQPIIVHSGSESSNPAGILFEAATDKIWSQAGIDVHFLPIVTITNALYFNLSSNIQLPNSLHSLAQASGSGASPDRKVLNLWFVNTIDYNPGAMGFALQTSVPFGTVRAKNGMAISKYALSYGEGRGMHDIVAHELGHNLGLYHGMDESGYVQATGQLNLMSRTALFPLNSDAITPHGAYLCQMNDYQIRRALAVYPFVLSLPPSETYEYTPVHTPAAPSDLTAISLSSVEIRLSWDDNSDDEDGFRIYRSVDNYDFYEVGFVGPNVTFFTDSGLNPGTFYHYEVVASRDDMESDSTEATVATLMGNPPAAPGNFAASTVNARITTGTATVNLRWDPVDDALFYNLMHARSPFGPWVPVASGILDVKFSDNVVADGSRHYYFVTSENAAGRSLSSRIISVAPVSPAPQNLSVVPAAAGLELQWIDRSSDEQGFTIEIFDGQFWVPIGHVSLNVKKFTFLGTPPPQTSFRVRAFRGPLFSEYSNIAAQ